MYYLIDNNKKLLDISETYEGIMLKYVDYIIDGKRVYIKYL